MGCGGGYRDLFRAVDYYTNARGGCGSNRQSQYNHYQQDDREEKLMLIKKMYVEDLIDDQAYQDYKQRVYDRRISFDELIAIKRSKSKEKDRVKKTVETKSAKTGFYNKYEVKIDKLKASREKISEVHERLQSSIKDLEKEKKRMEDMADAMLKSSEDTAEKYINKKLDLDENIQNLVRRNKELEEQLGEIEGALKELEAKKLELEAVRLQEELSNIRLEGN